MKNATKISMLIMTAAAFAMILAGCAKVPQTEVDAVKTALEAAKAADAQTYAPESFNAAMDAVTALDNELKAQEQLGAVKRKYDKSLTLASDAKAAAEKAAGDAEKAKEAMKAEVADLINIVNALIPQAKERVAKAAKVKGIKLDSSALAAQLETGLAAVTEAGADLNAGKLAEAKAKVTAVQEQLAAGEEIVKAALDAAAKPVKKK